MAETKKKPAAKKETAVEKPKEIPTRPVRVQPELTREQKRLLERHERREALRRKWGMT